MQNSRPLIVDTDRSSDHKKSKRYSIVCNVCTRIINYILHYITIHKLIKWLQLIITYFYTLLFVFDMSPTEIRQFQKLYF